MATDLEIVPRGQTLPSLPDLWARFVLNRGPLALNSLTGYDAVGRKVFRFFKDGRIDEDSVDQFHIWRVHEGTGVSRYNHDVTRIRSFLLWLYEMGFVPRDYRNLLPMQKMPTRPDPPLWSDEEYETVKDYCKDRAWAQLPLWLWILAYRTGMEMKDCCHLRWCDVELNIDGPSFIDVYRIKLHMHGDKARCLIPVIPGTDIHEWLLKLKTVNKFDRPREDGITDYVHIDAPSSYSDNRFHDELFDDFHTIWEQTGVRKKGRTFRHLRHTFCSNLINSGAQFSLICRMTGHQNMSTLLRYLKPDRRSLQENLAKAFEYSASQSKRPITIVGSTSLIPADRAT